jgi:hypothetical protein
MTGAGRRCYIARRHEQTTAAAAVPSRLARRCRSDRRRARDLRAALYRDRRGPARADLVRCLYRLRHRLSVGDAAERDRELVDTMPATPARPTGGGSMSEEPLPLDYDPPPSTLTPEQLAAVNLAVETFYATIRRRAPQADRLRLVTVGAARLLVAVMRNSPQHIPALAAAINPELATADCKLVLLQQ